MRNDIKPPGLGTRCRDEKDALRPLPTEPFVLAAWATAKTGPDIHAQVDRVLYSAPWRHIGKTADVRINASMVQFFSGGQLVKTHPCNARGKQTDFGDYPSVMWNLRPRQAASDFRPGRELASNRRGLTARKT